MCPQSLTPSTASELKVGDTFQFNTRKNGKRHTVNRDYSGHGPLEIGGKYWKGSVPDAHAGKLFILVDHCRQMILSLTCPIYLCGPSN